MPATEYYKQVVLDASLRGEDINWAEFYIGLASSLPVTDSTIPSEITAGEYQRLSFVPTLYTDGSMTNTAKYEWAAASVWASVNYVFISNSSQGGKAVLYDSVDSVDAVAGTIIRIPIGNFTIT